MSSFPDRLRRAAPLALAAACWALPAGAAGGRAGAAPATAKAGAHATSVPSTPAAAAATAYPGVGRAATAKEIAAWDIDVRPDFKGLPKGSGTVEQGMAVWESKCASCHGVFGEANEVFSPLVGGTTKEDVKTGRVARLTDAGFPGRTTLMKVPYVSTLWDYIHRAMPWNQPKSLKPDEVYAVTAYLLNLGGIVPDDFTLSDATMPEAQSRLPNRNGMTTEHGLWPGASLGNRVPDVKAPPCMHNCGAEPKIASALPEHALNAHGNLADQNRRVGAQRGMQTAAPAAPASAASAAAGAAAAPAPLALMEQHSCTACHRVDSKVVGPAFRDIGKKYASRPDALAYLLKRIREGGAGVWGDIPMPPQTLPEADAEMLLRWILKGAPA